MLICDFCGKEVNNIWHSPYGKICPMCEYLLLGRSLNYIADYSYKTKDGIVLWIKDFKVTCAWVDDGATSINIKSLKEKVGSDNPAEVINWIRNNIIKEEQIFCSMCGKLIKKGDIAGTHFAGSYCQPCWEEYKRNNSRKCYICGQPMWKCVC